VSPIEQTPPQDRNSPPLAPALEAEAFEAKPDAEGGPLSPDEVAGRAAEIADFFTHLRKAFKTIGLYRHATDRYASFLELSYNILSALLTRHGRLTFKVEQSSLVWNGVAVYQDSAEENNLAFRFFRDGIRFIRFRPGLRPDELLDFVLVCLSRRGSGEAGEDDLVSELWKKHFEHVEYVAMDTFALGDATASAETRVEVDAILNHLVSRLTTASSDGFAFARLSVGDVELEFANIERAAGVLLAEDAAAKGVLESVRKELARDAAGRRQERFLEALLAQAQTPWDESLRQSIGQILSAMVDTLLLQENLALLNVLLERLEAVPAMGLPHGNAAGLAAALAAALDSLSQEIGIRRLVTICNTSADPELLSQAGRLLRRLPDSVFDTVLQCLDGENRIECRKLLVDFLAERAAAHLDRLEKLLLSSRANTVRDALAILERLDVPHRVRRISRLLSHPNMALRLEALAFVGKSGDPEAIPVLSRACGDPDPQVRIAAVRLLALADPRLPVRLLLPMFQDPAFGERDAREQTAVVAALAATGDAQVLELLRRNLLASSLLNKKRLLEQKKTLVMGILESSSIVGFQFLRQMLTAPGLEPEIRALAERGLKHLREKLLGKGAGGGGGGG